MPKLPANINGNSFNLVVVSFHTCTHTLGPKPSSSSQSGVSKIHKEDGAAVLVPIISPENLQTQDVGIHPSAIVSEKAGDTEPSASCAVEKDDFFPALFVFGGMDTCGTVHGDCFVFIPHLSARS